MELPAQMKALVRSTAKWQPGRPSAVLDLVERPVPVPGRGQVLVKIEAAGCNPSDLSALAGDYARSQSPGEICGFEGCGRVVASGGGLLGAYLKGRRVACATDGQGLWAEYAVVSARLCLPVSDDMPMSSAAAFVVNPMTSWVLTEIARKSRAPAVVMSAGASQASRGALALCKASGIAVIAIVRRESQVAELKAAGAGEALNETASGFAESLRSACARLGPKLFFDAIGGSFTATVLAAMPNDTEVVVYGGLSDVDRIDAPLKALIFRGIKIRGFWLPVYLRSASLPKILRIARDVRRLFAAGIFSTRVAGTSSLADFPKAIDAYVADMSAGKRFAVMHR